MSTSTKSVTNTGEMSQHFFPKKEIPKAFVYKAFMTSPNTCARGFEVERNRKSSKYTFRKSSFFIVTKIFFYNNKAFANVKYLSARSSKNEHIIDPASISLAF